MRTQYLIIEVTMMELEQAKENIGADIKRLVEGELQYVKQVRIVDEVTVRCSPSKPCMFRESSNP
jgi:hypothetical protein